MLAGVKEDRAQEPHIVIVGGGFGGLRAARELGGSPVRVTLIDRRNHHLFQPLLYQVATAGLSPADIATPIRGILHRQENTEVLLAELSAVDVRAREVVVNEVIGFNRRIRYDYLVLATGATHGYFGNEQWAKFAPGLKSVIDATQIRRKILLAFEAAESEPDPVKRKELLTFIIVGAGPTGVELAGALYELSHVALASDFRHINPKSARILLIEAGPRILAAFSEQSARKARKKLESSSVEVRTGSRVRNVDAQGVVVGSEFIAARTVLWAAGVVASPAARWLGVQADEAGRVKVGPDLTIADHPEIFVIGDTSTLEQDGTRLPGVAPVALQQGKYVAKIIDGEIAGRVRPSSRPAFRYRDKGNLATVGRAYAVVEFKRLRETGFFAWILWLLVHIYYLIGFRNRLVVLLEWAWAYLTFQRGARLIISDRPELASEAESEEASTG